ncbi:MAG: DUF1858 domain-containing protein [Methermicoccaceae archaeon]
MITKDMKITDVVVNYPETLVVFMQYGMGCIGCQIAAFETVEEGALVHGLDVDALVADLNAVVNAKGGSNTPEEV